MYRSSLERNLCLSFGYNHRSSVSTAVGSLHGQQAAAESITMPTGARKGSISASLILTNRIELAGYKVTMKHLSPFSIKSRRKLIV